METVSNRHLLAGRNFNNLRYADDTPLMAENKEEIKSLFMKVKEENEKVVLKLNIQKTKVIASSSITSWQIHGEKKGNSDRFYFLGLMVTGDMKLKDACSLEENL